ncbi:MAG: DUF1806 family protein [Firmicutes bacterium]|nr:DUF1806 family protein [Bacillota bacterium]
MERLQASVVANRLQDWTGQRVYVHLEVNPGAYWRNGSAVLSRGHVKGDGSYRVYLELDDGSGMIHVDDLTHMEVTDDMLIVIGFDDIERLARTLEVSLRPFPMRGEEES